MTTDNDGVLSLRKESDLNEEVITIEASVDECLGSKFCKQYVNTDDQEVIYITSDEEGEHAIRCLIKKEGNWCEINVDRSKTLDEQLQLLQAQSKTINTNLTLNNKIADAKGNQLLTIDLPSNNNRLEQPH